MSGYVLGRLGHEWGTASTLGRVLRILGIPIRDDDARWLVFELYRDAHPPAVAAALMIERGVERDLYAIALSPDERRAILGVLGDPPEGLAELRGVLMREHEF